jgi:hypothetical protein
MNTALLTKFTPDVLRGAISLGLENNALIALLGVTSGNFSRLISGSEILDIKQARVIERKTNRTIGELAVLGIECTASPERRAKEVQLVQDTLELMKSFATKPAAFRASRKGVKKVQS